MALDTRNYPPEHGIRVPFEVHTAFVADVLRAAGMDHEGARLVAGILAGCDRRCVFSHGTRKLGEYLSKMRDGRVNPRPQVRVERENGATAVIDGDGGLGYHACHVGMTLAIERARELGVGAVTTWNHYHFGAAGNWTRMALAHDMVGLAISSHRFEPRSAAVVAAAAGSSPISWAIPAGEQPPLILDMGASFLPLSDGLMARFPHVFFKALGIGSVNVVLGGLLAGIWRTEALPPDSKWESNQGSFLTAWDVARFMDVDDFKARMDHHVGRARQMRPFPAMDRAELPGGTETAWEIDNARFGIPLGDAHRELLETFAAEAGVATPYARYEDTRF